MLSFDKASCHMLQSFFVPSQWQFRVQAQSSARIPKCRIRGSRRNRWEMPGWSGLWGWIVGLLRTYMTSVARAAGHWVLGCRDCLGKLLRQLRARGKRGKRQGGLEAGLLAQRQTQERQQQPVSLEIGRPHILQISRDTHKCTSQFPTIKKDKTLIKTTSSSQVLSTQRKVATGCF